MVRRKASTAQAPCNLACLIERRRTDYRESYADIARRAGLSKPYIYKLATHPEVGMPRAATIAALARGLQTTEAAVRQAAMESAHLVIDPIETRDPAVEALVASVQGLDPDEMRTVQALVESVIASWKRPRR